MVHCKALLSGKTIFFHALFGFFHLIFGIGVFIWFPLKETIVDGLVIGVICLISALTIHYWSRVHFLKKDFFQTQNDPGKNRQNPVISVFSHCVILFVSTLCLVHVLIIFTSNKDQVFNLVKVIWSFLSFSYISS